MPIKSLLKPDIKEWLQKSIHSELFASNLYKHIANHSQRMGFFGMQKYFLAESADELIHYQKLVDYINDLGDVASIPMTEAFTEPFTSIGQILNKAYTTELDLMRQYEDFYEDAEEGGDCITAQFVLAFLQIQRESVGEFGDLIARYEKNPTDVFEFDEYMEDLVK